MRAKVTRREGEDQLRVLLEAEGGWTTLDRLVAALGGRGRRPFPIDHGPDSALYSVGRFYGFDSEYRAGNAEKVLALAFDADDALLADCGLRVQGDRLGGTVPEGRRVHV